MNWFTDWLKGKKEEAFKIERVGNIEFFLGKKTMFANTTYDSSKSIGESPYLELYQFCDDLKCKGYVMKHGFMNGLNYYVYMEMDNSNHDKSEDGYS